MADVRAAVGAWCEDYGVISFTDHQLLRLAQSMVRQEYTEDKLAAALFLKEHVLPAGRLEWKDALSALQDYFDDGFLADWNVVDWFCVKPLAGLVDRDGAACGKEVLGWSAAPNLWRARASLVTFANVASRGEMVFAGFPAGALEASADLIVRPERFAKTAVGWTLRGLREAAPALVDGFVAGHLSHFNLEALRSVLKNADPEVRRGFVQQFQAA